MYTLLEKAKGADQKVFDKLGSELFSIGKAQLYSVEVQDNGDIDAVVQYENGDVYELLESADAHRVAKKSKNILILTCGWAAPLPTDENDDSEVAPSQHPARRRVALMIVAGDDGIVSTIRFADSDEVVVDEGKAQGSLAEAIYELWKGSRD